MKHVLLTLLFCFVVVLSACDEMRPTQEIVPIDDDNSSEIYDNIPDNEGDETTPTDDDPTSNEQEQEILDDNSSTIDLCVGGCPQLAPPSSDWCKDGDRVSRQPDECGCTGTPLCLDKEYCAGMSYADAWRVALQSECVDEHVLNVSDYVCNEGTNTWWIDLQPNKEGCNPACVVSAHTETAEINWRCTGVLPQEIQTDVQENTEEINDMKSCYEQGERLTMVTTYGGAYTFQGACCEGLIRSDSSGTTSIAGTCYQQSNVPRSGSAIINDGLPGYCIRCGDGICGEQEGLCNCPEDCIDSKYETIHDWCASSEYESECYYYTTINSSVEDMSDICRLCKY